MADPLCYAGYTTFEFMSRDINQALGCILHITVTNSCVSAMTNVSASIVFYPYEAVLNLLIYQTLETRNEAKLMKQPYRRLRVIIFQLSLHSSYLTTRNPEIMLHLLSLLLQCFFKERKYAV